ncbi:hypothetical protein [Sutterella megalosphaeroides]|uniref:Uncharacterized protein n=1 Tax=Sutterella megalosphaeroides TaxID=2494234 RepID=A0A2Z6I9D3_9BURK|nr:hypothetical protein [Sutterella megalosphaeroides]BBF23101.1 hypothetical protein SUTMEG_09920 [Sutterella megalosphaeroides]
MRDPTSLEPKNGDFVAYVEALQADQAALLKAANSGRMSLSDMEEVLEESDEPRASATAALLESLRKRARDAVMSLPSGHSSGSNSSTGSGTSDGAVLTSPIGRKRTGRRKDARSATPFGRLVGYGVAALGFALLLIFMNLPDSEPAVPFAVMMIFAGLYLAGGDAKKK